MQRRKPQTQPDDPAAGYQAAIKLLGYRWQGKEELRRKLMSKGFSKAAVEPALERLEQEGWLNDERFALAYARTRGLKNVGKQRIERELRASGIDPATAHTAAEESAEGETETRRLRLLCSKRMRLLARGAAVDWEQDLPRRNKLIGYLLHQGYEYSAVTDVIREIARESRTRFHVHHQ